MKTLVFQISNLTNSGGTQRMLTLLCNSLVDDYKITVMTNMLEEQTFYLLDQRVQILNISEGKRGFLNRNLQIYKILKESKCDYYINIDANSVLFNGFLLPKKTKLIIWEHFSLENNFKKWHFKLSRFYASFRADKFVLLSKFERELWVKKYKTPLKKIEVIYNPLPLIVHNDEIQNKYNNRTVIAIGNNIEIKGFDLLLKAWANIKTDWSLQIIGLAERKRHILLDIIKKSKIANVSIYGRVTDIENFYRNASFFVLSSRREATPLVLVESQAYGLPVVAFDHITSVKEIGDNSVLYVSYDEKEKALKRTIQNLIEDKELYNEYHEKSLKNIKRFSTVNFIKTWKIILK